MTLEQRFWAFSWEMTDWVEQQYVLEKMPPRTKQLLERGNLTLTNGYLHFFLEKQFGKLSLEQFNCFEKRLCLLTATEQERLAFGLAVLPLAGKLSKSIDGHLRKSLAKYCTPEQITQLDGIRSKAVSCLSAHAWRNEGQVIEQALGQLEQLQKEQLPGQMYATLWRWHNKTTPSAAVCSDHFTVEDVKTLCKILLPDLPWLLL